MSDHCGQFSDEYPGKAVQVVPELRDILVMLSSDVQTWVSVFECSICGQLWEEAYEATGHGERPMVRKLGTVEGEEYAGADLPNDPAVTSEAIVVWTGHGRKAWPARDEALLVERFGDDAADLLRVVKRLAHEFYESDAKHVGVDLKAMGDQAVEEFRSRHPEITEEAVEALAWCYTWDHK